MTLFLCITDVISIRNHNLSNQLEVPSLWSCKNSYCAGLVYRLECKRGFEKFENNLKGSVLMYLSVES